MASLGLPAVLWSARPAPNSPKRMAAHTHEIVVTYNSRTRKPLSRYCTWWLNKRFSIQVVIEHLSLSFQVHQNSYQTRIVSLWTLYREFENWAVNTGCFDKGKNVCIARARCGSCQPTSFCCLAWRAWPPAGRPHHLPISSSLAGRQDVLSSCLRSEKAESIYLWVANI